MTRRLPPIAILLGLAGLLPFLLCGLGAVAVPTANVAPRMLLALIAYGAVILAFLGGVHWGFALLDDAPLRTERLRFGLGVLPSLIGWTAMILAVIPATRLALIVLILGFIGTTGVEVRAQRRGLMPARYMRLRWLLSVVVVATLAAVLILRLLGQEISL